MSSWDVHATAGSLIENGYKVFRLKGDTIQRGGHESEEDFLRRQKQPGTTHGFKNAISSKQEVHPHFKLGHWIGIVPPKDMFFLDIDELRDKQNSREEARHQFLSLWENKPHVNQQTARGGIHVGPFYHPHIKQGSDIYENHPELHRFKVDIRMGGCGYIATGPIYTLLDGFPPIIEAQRLPDAFVPQPKATSKRTTVEKAPEETEALLKYLCEELRSKPPGHRNQPLFDAALKMGHHVGARLITYETTFNQLVEASTAGGHNQQDAEKTAKSGLATGMQHEDAIIQLQSPILLNGDHETIAQQIVKDCQMDGGHGLMVLDSGESFYRYDPDSGWNPLTRGEMEQLVLTKCSGYRFRGKKGLQKVANTKKSRAEVLDFLKYNYALQESRSELPKYNGHSCSRHQISVANGILNLKTKDLIPHSPKLLTVSRLPVAWQGTTEPTEWLRFLESSIPAEEDRKTLQMWMGYLLTPDTTQQKMMWLVGRKRSGKGTILRIIGELLGHLSGGTQLESLGTEYGLQNLYDKSSITIGDADISKKDQAMLRARLLSIVGEDEVVVNRKNRDLLHLKLPARLTLAANRNIPFENADGALSARMLCINFPNSFHGQEDLTLFRPTSSGTPCDSLLVRRGVADAAGRKEISEYGTPLNVSTKPTRSRQTHVGNGFMTTIRQAKVAFSWTICMWSTNKPWTAEKLSLIGL